MALSCNDFIRLALSDRQAHHRFSKLFEMKKRNSPT